MDTRTGEIMSAEKAREIKDAVDLNTKEAEEYVPLHLEERLERMERKQREVALRQQQKNALKRK